MEGAEPHPDVVNAIDVVKGVFEALGEDGTAADDWALWARYLMPSWMKRQSELRRKRFEELLKERASSSKQDDSISKLTPKPVEGDEGRGEDRGAEGASARQGPGGLKVGEGVEGGREGSGELDELERKEEEEDRSSKRKLDLISKSFEKVSSILLRTSKCSNRFRSVPDVLPSKRSPSARSSKGTQSAANVCTTRWAAP